MKHIIAAGVMAIGLAVSAAALARDDAAVPASPGALRFYWIDVEGGASTLIVSPAGRSLLFDTGFATADDRDAKRIFATAQRAGVKRIDDLVISHWHGDHVGGLPALAKLMPIGHFYDHGDGVEAADKARHDAYAAIAGHNRTIAKAGDTIAFDGARVEVVSSESILQKPLDGAGAPNPLCANAQQMAKGAPENQRMVGLSIAFGKFRYLSVADLDWQKEMELVCPNNKLGRVNLYLVSRHGSLDDSGSPPFLGAISPQVVIINNGPRKGLGQRDDRIKLIAIPGETPAPYEHNSYLRLAKLPGVEDIWQEHLSLLDKDPAHNTAPDRIANLEGGAGDKGNGIAALVEPDGTFVVTNGRNGFSKTYTAR